MTTVLAEEVYHSFWDCFSVDQLQVYRTVRSTEQKGNFKTIFSSKFLSFFPTFQQSFWIKCFWKRVSAWT